MKNLIFIFLLGLFSMVVTPLQSVAYTVDKQPCIESVTIAVDMIGSTITTPEVVDISYLTMNVTRGEQTDTYVDETEDRRLETEDLTSRLNYIDSEITPIPDLLKVTDRQLVNYAGFGAFLYTSTGSATGAQDDVVAPAEGTIGEKDSGSIINLITSNWTVVFGLLLAISEILALIPGISQNGIFQTIFGWLKVKNKIGV